MVIVEFMAISRAWVREASGVAVLVADGILVDRSIGLGCAVVGRGDAVTGFTAIIAVSIIHCTVWILIYTKTQNTEDTDTEIAKEKSICVFTVCLLILFIFIRVQKQGRERV